MIHTSFLPARLAYSVGGKPFALTYYAEGNVQVSSFDHHIIQGHHNYLRDLTRDYGLYTEVFRYPYNPKAYPDK